MFCFFHSRQNPDSHFLFKDFLFKDLGDPFNVYPCLLELRAAAVADENDFRALRQALRIRRGGFAVGPAHDGDHPRQSVLAQRAGA